MLNVEIIDCDVVEPDPSDDAVIVVTVRQAALTTGGSTSLSYLAVARSIASFDLFVWKTNQINGWHCHSIYIFIYSFIFFLTSSAEAVNPGCALGWVTPIRHAVADRRNVHNICKPLGPLVER